MSRIVGPMLLMLLGAAGGMAYRAPNEASEEARVRSLEDQERVAALNRDVPALERLWSDRFTINARNDQVVVGRRAVLDTFVHGNIIDFAPLDRTIEHVRVDGDLAVVMGVETMRLAGDASLAGQTVQRRFTNIWRREGDAWHLYARHVDVRPPH